MKRFRTITIICLTAIAVMVVANVWYLQGLYSSIKEQTMKSVRESVRRADILEIIDRIATVSGEQDDSFIRLSLMIQGEKNAEGGYEYSNMMENMSQTMSEYFHVIEKADPRMPQRNYSRLDTLFQKELINSGIHLDRATIISSGENLDDDKGLWKFGFSIAEGQEPIYTVYLSPLQKHILGQMAGIIATSAAILVLMIFLIWYLLHWVGKLRTIEQMKDDFTHNMTHELKTPVAVAYSAADSMLRYYDQSDEARNKQFLRIIMQRLSFLSGMIENILSMSMERFKTIQLQMETLNVKPVIWEIAAMIELKADKPVQFEIDIPEGLTVEADHLHFGNIISNLMDNAVKYSGDEVTISVKAEGDTLIIQDNGIGIAKENLPYIFDKFYRVTSGDIYEVGGYGLGLFYVRRMIELFGWDISVNSQPGKGTTFTIKFKGDEKG